MAAAAKATTQPEMLGRVDKWKVGLAFVEHDFFFLKIIKAEQNYRN